MESDSSFFPPYIQDLGKKTSKGFLLYGRMLLPAETQYRRKSSVGRMYNNHHI